MAARRRNRKPGLISKMPWQLNLALSASSLAAAYFHSEVGSAVANLAVAASQSQGELIQNMAASTAPAAAFGFLIAGTVLGISTGLAGSSKGLATLFDKRKARRAMRDANQAAANSKSLDDLEWREFEYLVGQVFKDQGFKVQMGKGSQDGGIDITLANRKGETLIVQCKHWKGTSVGAPQVREMAGAVQLHGAKHGAIVCSGRFTQNAWQEAKELGITLVDGKQIMKHLQVDV